MDGGQGDHIGLGHLLIQTSPSFGCFLSQLVPLNHMAELKQGCFYGRLPKCLKAMVAYLKASPQEQTYSHYLWAAREVEKEDSTELSQSP